MKTRDKLTILLSVLIVLFFAGSGFLRNMGKKDLAFLFQKELADKKSSFDKIIELKGKSLQNMVNDYTFWDEMVNFIYFKDTQWAKQNINEALYSFNTNAAWIYAPDFTLVYSINNMDNDEIKDLPFVPKKFLYEYFLKQDNRFLHFFTETKNGILEIRAASVHPTSDPQRTTPPRGFFFVAKLWNADYIKELSDLTGNQISLNMIPNNLKKAESGRPENGEIYFSKALPNWEGNDLARLQIKTTSESIKSLNAMSNNYSFFFSFFIIFFLSSACIAIIKLVLEPLHLISCALKNKDANLLGKLSLSKTEFGAICQMIEIHFKQRAMLEEEINARKRAENLLKLNKEKFKDYT